jgi:hypothetical protein
MASTPGTNKAVIKPRDANNGIYQEYNMKNRHQDNTSASFPVGEDEVSCWHLEPFVMSSAVVLICANLR